MSTIVDLTVRHSKPRKELVMTKRHVTMIQNAYKCILSDVLDDVPEAVGLNRDHLRLCSAVKDRGLKFFTIDLVDAGKHFDKCLAASRLCPSMLPHQRPYKKGSVIPRLFRGLLSRVFDDNGCLLSVPCIRSIRHLRQLYNLAKKLKIECEKEKTNDSVKAFFRTDSGVLSPSLSWDADHFEPERAFHLRYDDKLSHVSSSDSQPSLDLREDLPRLRRYDVRAIHFAQDIIAVTLGAFNPEDWRGRHGPGAVADLRRGSKYDFPTWPLKLESRFPMSHFAYANYGIWADEIGNEGHRFKEEESPAKLIAVPKTQKGPRLIASEPVSHQWIQQLIKDFLYHRIEHSWIGKSIHLRDQTYNQRAAMQASIDQSSWTIDLSEASDRVSCYVVERAFRCNVDLLASFHACRTRYISNDIDLESPRLHRLRKFSTMGSALTFPVQSLLFLGIVVGCLISQRNMQLTQKNVIELSKEVLVFGDDLIVPKDVGYLVLGALRYLGFKVNHSKTFGNGNFRESCGGEYFCGHDVTPGYLLTYPDRRRPESLISSVQTRNNFYLKGYFGLAEYLKSTVREEGSLILPHVASDSGMFGWASFEGASYMGLRSRLNRFTHHREVWVHGLSARVTKTSDRYGSRLLQYFTEEPPPTAKWTGGVPGRPSLRLKRGWVAVR
jgi:hypothetical protein